MNLSNIWNHPRTSIAGVLIGILTVAGVLSQQGVTLGHIGDGTVVALIGALATALLGLLAHDPKAPAPLSVMRNDSAKKLGAVIFAALLLSLAIPARAQTDIPSPPAPGVANFYAAGVSYNSSATPNVAGTALYARQASGGTYLFTSIDALPASVKPFTVTTNLGAGVAQKLATVGKAAVYVPTAAGISFSGQNTGWQWNAGVLAVIHIRGQYYLAPEARFVKSSVSNGSGYQPIVGVLFGWGQ